MQLHFTGRNFEITPALKSLTEDKLQRLNRYPTITQVNVVFQVEHVTHIAEATVHIDGIEINAKAESDDMYKTVDEMINKLITQINKHKEKISGHR